MIRKSAFDPQRTLRLVVAMSTFGRKADMPNEVRSKKVKSLNSPLSPQRIQNFFLATFTPRFLATALRTGQLRDPRYAIRTNVETVRGRADEVFE
jgi:hypothetical protein